MDMDGHPILLERSTFARPAGQKSGLGFLPIRSEEFWGDSAEIQIGTVFSLFSNFPESVTSQQK
eukprot:389414-Prorocentrum_minimum.AAC.1